MKKYIFILITAIIFFVGCANSSGTTPQTYNANKDTLVIILNNSMLMADTDPANNVIIYAAKSELANFVDTLDKTKTNAGLVTLGCLGSNIEVSFDNDNFLLLSQKIKQVENSYCNFVAGALDKVVKLTRNFNKTLNIILLTNSDDEYDSNLFEYSLELRRRQSEVNLFVVGYNIYTSSKEQLTNLPVGKGKFMPVYNPEQLQNALKQIAQTLNLSKIN